MYVKESRGDVYIVKWVGLEGIEARMVLGLRTHGNLGLTILFTA